MRMVEAAVFCEPVSASNSLLTGKNTGKFGKTTCSTASTLRLGPEIRAQVQYSAEKKQGILRIITGNPQP